MKKVLTVLALALVLALAMSCAALAEDCLLYTSRCV